MLLMRRVTLDKKKQEELKVLKKEEVQIYQKAVTELTGKRNEREEILIITCRKSLEKQKGVWSIESHFQTERREEEEERSDAVSNFERAVSVNIDIRREAEVLLAIKDSQ